MLATVIALLCGSDAKARNLRRTPAAANRELRSTSTFPDLLPYDDIANTRFCFHIDHATQCHVDLYCGDDSPCPEGMLCRYNSGCHLHDLIEVEKTKAGEDEERQEELTSLDADDQIRFHACGTSWTDAEEKCGAWCWGRGGDCPDGQGCFRTSSCYRADGLE